MVEYPAAHYSPIFGNSSHYYLCQLVERFFLAVADAALASTYDAAGRFGRIARYVYIRHTGHGSGCGHDGNTYLDCIHYLAETVCARFDRCSKGIISNYRLMYYNRSIDENEGFEMLKV